MAKDKVRNILFSDTLDVRVRVISDDDSKEAIKNKKKYPFELFNTVQVQIKTDKLDFLFSVFNGYTWNGADIPRFLWRLVGSRTDNDFLVASMIHDYMLEFKTYMMKEILSEKITKREYRRLTSLAFRELIKRQGTNVIKANIMSWCVDVFQMCNIRSWRCL